MAKTNQNPVKENGKVLCDEPLTQAVQAQKGFLY